MSHKVDSQFILKTCIFVLVTIYCIIFTSCSNTNFTNTSTTTTNNPPNLTNNSSNLKTIQTTTIATATTTKVSTTNQPTEPMSFWGPIANEVEDFSVDTNEDIYTVSKFQPAINKYDKYGKKLSSWNIQVDAPHQISVDPLGNVYVSGQVGDDKWIDTGAPIIRYHYNNSGLQKFDASGKLMWTRQYCEFEYNRYHGRNNNHITALTTDLQGNVYIGGQTNALQKDVDLQSGIKAYIIKYNKDGELLWKKTFGHPDIIDPNCLYNSDEVCSISIDKNMNVFVTGLTNFPGPTKEQAKFSFFLDKFDVNGNSLWSKEFPSIQIDDPQVDSNGNVYISGMISDEKYLPQKQFMSKYSSYGELVWDKQLQMANPHAIPGTNNIATAQWLIVDSNNFIYFTDKTQGGSILRKYDSNGKEMWYYAYNNPDRFQKHIGDFYIIKATSNEILYIYLYGLTSLSTSTQQQEWFFAKLDSRNK